MAENLNWPEHFPRTRSVYREQTKKYTTTISRAFDDLETELDRLGVDDYRYSFDAPQRKTDQRPYAQANPDDPSFVLQWSMDGEQYVVACDRYSRLRDNVRTIGLYINEKRKMEKRPVHTGESEFANARLPPGDEHNSDVVGDQPPHKILGVSQTATRSEIIDAYRDQVKQMHPDVGGRHGAFTRLKNAKNTLLNE